MRVRPAERLVAADMITEEYPGFATDMQAQYMALTTQAEGASAVTETIFENRFLHASEMVRMGANISIDGRRAVVRGPAQLSGTTVQASDLRASARSGARRPRRQRRNHHRARLPHRPRLRAHRGKTERNRRTRSSASATKTSRLEVGHSTAWLPKSPDTYFAEVCYNAPAFREILRRRLTRSWFWRVPAGRWLTWRTKNCSHRLDAAIAEKNLLKHPFYQDWQAGKLSRESLQLYAAQYYRHVEAFPKHLRVLAARTEGPLRDTVVENLHGRRKSRSVAPETLARLCRRPRRAR